MPPQKSGEIRRSRRLSEQKQRVDKGSLPGKGGHNSPQLSPTIDLTAEQADAVPSGCQTPDNTRKKAPATRPPNAFMLFRSDFWAREKLKVEPIERDHRDISRIAAICWNNLDDETKGVYRKRAKEHRALHRLQHPEYIYSPALQETARRGRRRTAKNGSVEDERCKRLAVKVMGEFQRGKWSRNNTRRVARDTDFQDPFEGAEELIKLTEDVEGTTEVSRGDPAMVCGDEPAPTFYSEGKENWMNGQTLIADVVGFQFGHKPRLEQYTPELQFWYAVVSHNEAADQLLLDSRNDPESAPRIETWNRAGREGVTSLDCEVELDEYFQFDRCDES